MTAGDMWRRGQIGWPRAFPILQFPNAPLLFAFAGRGLSVVALGRASRAGRNMFTLGLGAWAWEEAADGANWLRRLAGVVVLACLVTRPAAER